LTAQRRSVSRSFAILSSGQLIAKLFAFAVTVVLTRRLGVERYGLVTWATTLFMYLALAVDIGLSTLGPFEVARNEAAARPLAARFVSIRTIAAIPAFALTLAIAWLTPMPSITRTVIALFSALLLLQPFDLDWAFVGRQRMTPSVVADISGQLTLAASVVLLVRGPEDVFRVPILYVGARLVTVGVQNLAFARTWREPSESQVPARRLLRAALPLAGSSLVAMLLSNFDLLVLYLFLDARASGLYGAAYRLVWVPTIFVMAYYTSLKPVMARAAQEGGEAARALVRKSLRISTAVSVGVVAGGLFVARPLLDLVFTAEYSDATLPTCILIVALGLMILSRNYRWMLVACQRQDVDLKIMTITAIVNVAANVVLIPLAGIGGAAGATAFSEAIYLLLGASRLRGEIGRVPLARMVPLPVLCSIPMIALLYFTPSWHVMLRIAAGGALYAGCIVGMRVIPPSEIRDILDDLVPWSRPRPLDEKER